ncbi:MAG: ribonuclease HI family protein [Candidatus Thorarchaeota archaeon]
MSRISIYKEEILKIYTDGAARGNPGPAAYAFLLVYKDEIIHQGSGYIGNTTNNTAEYHAVINALKAAEKFHKGHLQIFSDSNLVVNQINKKWKIHYRHLSELCSKVNQLRQKYEEVEFFHATRTNTYIQKCDELCNSQLDKKGFK